LACLPLAASTFSTNLKQSSLLIALASLVL